MGTVRTVTVTVILQRVTMATLPLKGKIIQKPAKQMWFRIPESVQNEDHKYTCELEHQWTPFNSNLHMQGIKVLVNDPIPDTTRNPGSVEDTLLLLDIMREKKEQDNTKRKEEMIRDMAMQQKKKQEEKQRPKVFS